MNRVCNAPRPGRLAIALLIGGAGMWFAASQRTSEPPERRLRLPAEASAPATAVEGLAPPRTLDAPAAPALRPALRPPSVQARPDDAPLLARLERATSPRAGYRLAERASIRLRRSPREEAAWIERARSAEPRLRPYLLIALGMAGTPAARAFLLERVADGGLPEAERLGAALALAQEQDPARRARLVPQAAVRGEPWRRLRLGLLRDAAVREALALSLSDLARPAATREALIVALGPSLDQPGVLDALEQSWRGGEPGVRTAVLRELGGAAAARDLLHRALREERQPAARAAGVAALDPARPADRGLLERLVRAEHDSLVRAVAAARLSGSARQALRALERDRSGLVARARLVIELQRQLVRRTNRKL